VTTVTLRRARPDAASMLRDLAVAANGFWATTGIHRVVPGTSAPLVPTTSCDDPSWSPTWAAWWPAAPASTAIRRSASWATGGSGRARSAPASAGSCGSARWPRMADRVRQARAFPTSHARSDAGHRCPVELTVAARGLRTRLLESCLAQRGPGREADRPGPTAGAGVCQVHAPARHQYARPDVQREQRDPNTSALAAVWICNECVARMAQILAEEP
jgi:hypothetical protein